MRLYLLAYPAIWLHARWPGAERAPKKTGQQVLWGVLLLSALGTVAVQSPFVLHRAGTSELQRLAIIVTGFGFLLTGAASLFRRRDRKSTRLNSSHSQISYAVFCLKKKKLLHVVDVSCVQHLTPVVV